MAERTRRQITLERAGRKREVFVITFTGSSPNRANVFDADLLRRFDEVLREVEDCLEPCALIVTGRGRFFSAGFDLRALTGRSLAASRDRPTPPVTTRGGQEMVQLSWRLLARLLVFPKPTIAVFNGHAFGLGLFVGLACDHRIFAMAADDDGGSRSGAARLCLPEVDIGLPLGEGFAALARCKLPKDALRHSALAGRRWTPRQAREFGIVDAVVEARATRATAADCGVPREAVEMAEKLAPTSRMGSLARIKLELYGEAHSVLSGATSRL